MIITFDLYFPQLGGSCTDAGAEINGDGFGEDLFFKISSDYGETWSYVDSTLGGYPNWVSRMYEITEELNGFTSFIAAINYSDCNGNWSFRFFRHRSKNIEFFFKVIKIRYSL